MLTKKEIFYSNHRYSYDFNNNSLVDKVDIPF